MPDYLTSFFPLSCTKAGRNAATQFKLSAFRDGSCRLEPDFNHSKPAITGLCRPVFSKKLKVGDRVIYWTNAYGIGGSYVVAILKVIAKEPNHESAKLWYQENGALDIPQNLIVHPNVPHPFDHTHQIIRFSKPANEEKIITIWDSGYKQRAKEFSHVAICDFVFGPNLGLPNHKQPVLVTDDDKQYIFGRRPITQNPPALRNGEWERFMERLPFFKPYKS